MLRHTYPTLWEFKGRTANKLLDSGASWWNWKVVDLVGDTIKLCEFCGFKLVKKIRFMLPQQSFWRTNYRLQWEKKFKKPFPEEEFASVYRFETVLVFDKP